jgi:hypothetical protein
MDPLIWSAAVPSFEEKSRPHVVGVYYRAHVIP